MFRVSLVIATLFICVLLTLPQPAHGKGGVESCSPVAGSTRVSPHNNIVVRYAEPLYTNSGGKPMSLSVVGSKSGSHAGRLVLLEDARTLIFIPEIAFALGERVTVRAMSPRRTWSGEPLEPL